ncbi:MAG: Methylmalonyl-CoA mutase large subunit [Actinobacteria bacterium ADurb.Bin346]|nr:MAG: Methylmalonyl-CoA mutase large subunit [Actinobacteria bacterium ADurb.Bin346]
MENKKISTSEILSSGIKNENKTPLYNSDTLKKIRAGYDAIRASYENQPSGPGWEVTPHTILGSEIPRGLLYTPAQVSGLDYDDDIGFPGTEPFTRGVHRNMYRGKKFTIRQINGFGGPEDTNQRIKYMLEHGGTGISVIHDLPTTQMYDSDDPISKGQVGMSGVAIDSADDMEILFEDVPIDKITISLVTHYPSNTAILFPMYLAAAERRGIPFNVLKGSVQNDITLEEVVRSGPEYIPPKDCFRIQCDNIEFIKNNVPYFNFNTLNGYNLHEFGTSGVTEMAVALSNAIESLDEMIRRGYDIDWIAERLAFFWSISSDFFEEVSRIRAARRLWYKIMKYRFGAKSARAMWMRCHVQTSGISLVREEPLNNLIRASIQALSAVFAGVQSLHVDSYDEAYSVPTEEAALLSLRTQQIIQEETAVTEVVDPLGGSFYVEALTNEIEKRILDEIDEIEKVGGYVASIEKGWIHNRIANYFYREKELIDKGEIKFVGSNVYRAEDKKPAIEVFRYPEGVEERQKAKLAKLRLTRDNEKVSGSLGALEDACRKNVNIIPFSLECARVGCTVGEIFKVFKKSFGLWKPPVFW